MMLSDRCWHRRPAVDAVDPYVADPATRARPAIRARPAGKRFTADTKNTTAATAAESTQSTLRC